MVEPGLYGEVSYDTDNAALPEIDVADIAGQRAWRRLGSVRVDVTPSRGGHC